MAGHPSDKVGVGGGPDSGLDARLDRAVPTIGAEAFLLGVGGDHDGRVYPIWHNTALIGRSDDADVLVLDASVSARHAQLINGSQGFEIEDLGSTNGTQVEGRPVTRSVLQTGQLITIGQVEFRFLLHRRMDATLAVIPRPIQPSANPGTLVRQELPKPNDRPLYRPPAPSRAMSEDDEEGPSLEEIVEKVAVGYQYIRKNGLLLGAFVAICAFLGVISTVIIPPARQAECLLKLQPEVMINPVDEATHSSRPEDQEVRFFDSAETVFVQPKLVAGTLEKMLGHPLPETTVNSIAERLKLELTGENVYRASYREKLIGSMPLGPKELLSAHLDNYLHSEIARAIRVFAAQADFLRDQLTSAEADMNKISDQKMQFSQNNSDRLPDTASGTLSSRMDLEKRRADLSAQIRGLQGQLDAERHALTAEGPLAQSRYHASETYRTSLAEVNRKLSEAYAHGLADGHPEVRAIKEEKQHLEGLIAKEMETQTDSLDRASNAGFQDLQNRVALLQAQLSAARSDLADTEKDLKHVQNVVGDLPRVQAGVQHLVHMQEATTALHGQLFEQLKKAELQLKLERVSAESRYEVVKPPHLIATGRGKTAALRLTMGAAIGLLLGLATLGILKLRALFHQALSNINASRGAGTR
jgi:Inner membrane component of T3SS, cytoplasmic domain